MFDVAYVRTQDFGRLAEAFASEKGQETFRWKAWYMTRPLSAGLGKADLSCAPGFVAVAIAAVVPNYRGESHGLEADFGQAHLLAEIGRAAGINVVLMH